VAPTAVGPVATRADGKPIDAPDSLQPRLPVLLPGQRLGVGGNLLVGPSARVARLEAKISGTVAVPVAVFAAWARSMTVTDLRHTGPDGRGLSTVTGTLRTEPPATPPCSPDFNLILRDKKSKIIYGLRTTASTPTFEERFPAAADYSKAEVYVVQGADAMVSIDVAAAASCGGR
jgi:hypothetical protein